MNLRSRDNARFPFLWNNSEYFGFSESKPWLEISLENKENNVKNELGNDSILEFYKRLIDFRKNSEFSDILTYGIIESYNTGLKNVLAYKRVLGDKQIICFNNFNDKEIDINLDDNFKLIFDTFNEDLGVKSFKKLKKFQSILVYMEG